MTARNALIETAIANGWRVDDTAGTNTVYMFRSTTTVTVVFTRRGSVSSAYRSFGTTATDTVSARATGKRETVALWLTSTTVTVAPVAHATETADVADDAAPDTAAPLTYGTRPANTASAAFARVMAATPHMYCNAYGWHAETECPAFVDDAVAALDGVTAVAGRAFAGVNNAAVSALDVDDDAGSWTTYLSGRVAVSVHVDGATVHAFRVVDGVVTETADTVSDTVALLTLDETDATVVRVLDADAVNDTDTDVAYLASVYPGATLETATDGARSLYTATRARSLDVDGAPWTNTAVDGHPFVGREFTYRRDLPPVPAREVTPSTVVAPGMSVTVLSAFTSWGGPGGSDMLHVDVPATGYRTHVTPADCGLDADAVSSSVPAHTVDTVNGGNSFRVLAPNGSFVAGYVSRERADASAAHMNAVAARTPERDRSVSPVAYRRLPAHMIEPGHSIEPASLDSATWNGVPDDASAWTVTRSDTLGSVVTVFVAERREPIRLWRSDWVTLTPGAWTPTHGGVMTPGQRDFTAVQERRRLLDGLAIAEDAGWNVDVAARSYVNTLLWTECVETDDADADAEPVPFHEAGYTLDDVDASVFDTVARELDDVASLHPLAIRMFMNYRVPAVFGGWTTEHGDVRSDMFGYDYALTRNHHGAGFWDRGLRELGDYLTSIADDAGSSTGLYVHDGRIYDADTGHGA